MIMYIVYPAFFPFCILVYLSKSFMLAHDCLFVWFFSGCVTLSRFACLFIVGCLCFRVFSFCQQCTGDCFRYTCRSNESGDMSSESLRTGPDCPSRIADPILTLTKMASELYFRIFDGSFSL